MTDFRRSDLYPGEDRYFKENPGVAGMAAADNKVIINPYSENSQEEQDAVFQNELARVLMRVNDFNPAFDVTQDQRSYFSGTPYQNDEAAMRQTIAARIASGDPSAQTPTGDQLAFSKALSRMLQEAQK